MKRSLLYFTAAFLSGAMWFLIAWLFDDGWGIAPGLVGIGVGVICAMFTGLLIAALFRGAFHHAPILAFILLPCITLPLAIVAFSFFLWLGRLALGVRFSPAPAGGDLRLLTETYLFYGVFGSGPILYILALLNQYVMRRVLNRTFQRFT